METLGQWFSMEYVRNLWLDAQLQCLIHQSWMGSRYGAAGIWAILRFHCPRRNGESMRSILVAIFLRTPPWYNQKLRVQLCPWQRGHHWDLRVCIYAGLENKIGRLRVFKLWLILPLKHFILLLLFLVLKQACLRWVNGSYTPTVCVL